MHNPDGPYCGVESLKSDHWNDVWRNKTAINRDTQRKYNFRVQHFLLQWCPFRAEPKSATTWFRCETHAIKYNNVKQTMEDSPYLSHTPQSRCSLVSCQIAPCRTDTAQKKAARSTPSKRRVSYVCFCPRFGNQYLITSIEHPMMLDTPNRVWWLVFSSPFFNATSDKRDKRDIVVFEWIQTACFLRHLSRNSLIMTRTTTSRKHAHIPWDSFCNMHRGGRKRLVWWTGTLQKTGIKKRKKKKAQHGQ